MKLTKSLKLCSGWIHPRVGTPRQFAVVQALTSVPPVAVEGVTVMRRVSIACRAAGAVFAVAVHRGGDDRFGRSQAHRWQSESELRNQGSSAWSGYGDTGTLPARSRRAGCKGEVESVPNLRRILRRQAEEAGHKGTKKALRRPRYGCHDRHRAPAKSLTAAAVLLGGLGLLPQRHAALGRAQFASYAFGHRPTPPAAANLTTARSAAPRSPITSQAMRSTSASHGNVGKVYAFLRSHGSLAA